MNWPVIRIADRARPEHHADGTPPIPLAVRLRMEDEITKSWREFTEVWAHPLTDPETHERFWRYLTR